MTFSRYANIIGALALGLADDIVESATADTMLSGAEAAALALIGYEPGITINGLRAGLALSHPGTVRLVDRLDAAGLVTRVRHLDDGRAVALELTPNGRAASAAIIARRDSAVIRGLTALSPEEQGMMGALAAKMLRAMLRDEAHAYRVCRLCHFDRCLDCPVSDELEVRG